MRRAAGRNRVLDNRRDERASEGVPWGVAEVLVKEQPYWSWNERTRGAGGVGTDDAFIPPGAGRAGKIGKKIPERQIP